MGDSSNAANDSIYNDESAFNDVTGYPYDNSYQADNQWLYNDSKMLQLPQAGDSTGMDGTNGAGASGVDLGSGYNNYNNEVYGGNAVASSRTSSKDEGKLFVGGLSWETDENKLRDYFSKYGNILDCSIMRDQTTGRPRGFGFVTFEDISGVNAVLQEPTHTLDGKQIDPKHAIPRENQSTQNRTNQGGSYMGGNPAANMGMGGGAMGNSVGGDEYSDPIKEMKGDKIFVGGLPPSATDADLNSGFVEFGNIVETKLMMDRETGRSRGYGFLQFDSEEAALAAVKAGNSGDGIQIHGKRVDVKPAMHKKRAQMPNMGMMAGQNNGYGMMGMPGYGMMGMMGMPGYGMMGMPGYGMMGATGASSGSNADYSAAMGYGGFYPNMQGYYGAGSGAGDASGAASGADGTNPAAAAAAGYYGQMNMPMGYYGGADGQGDGSSANATPTTMPSAGGSGKGGDYSGSGHHDQHNGNSKGGRYNDDRGSHDRSDRGGRDNSHRSSSRRHGGSASNDGSGRERSRGEYNSHGGLSSRSRDDHRSTRGSRSHRDRDGPVRGSQGSGSSSRKHGYTPY